MRDSQAEDRCRKVRGYMRGFASLDSFGMTLPVEPDHAPPTLEFTGEIAHSLSFSTSHLCGYNQPNLVQWKIQMFAYLAGRGGSATQVSARIIRSI